MPDTAVTSNANIEFERLKPLIGSEVKNIDLTQPIDDATFAALRKELGERSVLIFKGQTMTTQQQVDFSEKFGPLELHVLSQYCHPEQPEIFMVSNIKEDGKHVGAFDGSQNYHIDGAYMAVPSLGSVFYCLEHPPVGQGGETVVVSMSAVYAALSIEQKALVKGRDAVHDYVWLHVTKHPHRPPLTQEQIDKVPPATHPMVVNHPETGVPTLHIDWTFCRNIVGMSDGDSRPILDELMTFADQDEFKYAHPWEPGDVMIWDNRSSVHKRYPFDTDNTRRMMHRTTITGEPPVFNG